MVYIILAERGDYVYRPKVQYPEPNIDVSAHLRIPIGFPLKPGIILFSTAMRSTPFSAAKLDTLLDESGIDILLVSSKHNLQYLLGGYRYYFFEHLDSIGLGRYLPVLGYVKA